MIISNMPHVLSGRAFGCAHIIAPEAFWQFGRNNSHHSADTVRKLNRALSEKILT